MKEVVNNLVSFCREWYHTESGVNLHEPRFNDTDRAYVLDAIDSTFVSSVGAYVDQVETTLAKYLKAKKVVAVVNGTSALHASLKIAGVTPKSEVITQSLSFVATANAISYLGAMPVFIDVDIDTMGLSPKALEAFLQSEAEIRENGCFNKKSGNRISACIPMHTFGFMAKIDELACICSRWKIPLIEDAAEALGSTYKGQHAGTFGQFGAISFNGNKIVTAGGGGAVVTMNEGLGKQAKHLTTTAKTPHTWEYVHDQVGFNYRMPNLNAALLCAQLNKLERYISDKKSLFHGYRNFFESISSIQLKEIPEFSTWNYWLPSIQLSSREERNEFLALSNEQSIRTRPVWELLYRLKMYKNCIKDDQINAQFLADRIVNLPASVRKD